MNERVTISSPPAATEDSVRAQLLTDYERAVIHMALNRNGTTGKRTLLLAWVELLPKEIPPPIDDYCDQWHGTRLGGSSKNVVHVRHAVVACTWALDWYLQCRAGRAVWPRWPRDEGFSEHPASVEEVLESTPLSEEPRWPRLVTHSEETTALPFAPGWVTCPRVHHLLPLEPLGLETLWTETEQSRGLAALSARLHFAVDQHSELWGSVHLVAPNPVYNRLRSRLHSREDGDSVLMRFQPRASATLDGLVLRFQERAPWGPNETRAMPAAVGTLRLDFDHVVGSVSEEVVDPVRGTLQVGDSSSAFMRSIQMEVQLSKVVKVMGRRPEDSFEVARAQKGQTSIVGTPPVVGPATRRLSEAWFARQARTQAKGGGDQEWFRGQQREARRALIQRIQLGHRAAMLVDPYFGLDELVLAEAVGHDDVVVRVLTARNLEEVSSAEVQTLWRRFLAELTERRARLPHNRVEVRVLSAGSLHDRFLVVDDRVWTVGCSFNKFGDRGSLLNELRDSKSMQGILATLWAEGRPLEELAAGEAA